MKLSFERKRILFVAEAVTLAHIVRPFVLAESLNPNRYDIHFASADFSDFIFKGSKFPRWSIRSIKPQQFLRALAAGKPLYNRSTLKGYIRDDLQLLDKVRPDLVIGDFRLSLAVSAPLRKIPYVALIDAYWSPYTKMKYFPLPELPIVKILGIPLSSFLFHRVQRLAFAYHASPLNSLRRKYRLRALGGLLNVYSYGDYTLYLDLPSLVPIENLPPYHRYIGPVFWSPQIEPPSWWKSLDERKPIIYISLGSSGDVDSLPVAIQALSELPLTAIVATAGRRQFLRLPENVRIADYLPGDQAARRAAVVICNGGSPTTYQALKEGVPVLGIASNMDQFLSMHYIKQAGAGILLRAGGANVKLIQNAVKEMMENKTYSVSAKQIAQQMSAYDAPSRFRSFVEEVLA